MEGGGKGRGRREGGKMEGEGKEKGGRSGRQDGEERRSNGVPQDSSVAAGGKYSFLVQSFSGGTAKLSQKKSKASSSTQTTYVNPYYFFSIFFLKVFSFLNRSPEFCLQKFRSFFLTRARAPPIAVGVNFALDRLTHYLQLKKVNAR
jgi:hypothetical protein